MATVRLTATISLLPPRQGGYHYLRVERHIPEQWPKKNKTRLLCTINGYTFPCGLNHLGDGDYFIIMGKEKMKHTKTNLGDTVQLTLVEDPNPLGVEEPELLQVYLDQDPWAKKKYNQLTDGKKRALIFSLQKTKNMDLHVQKIRTFLQQNN